MLGISISRILNYTMNPIRNILAVLVFTLLANTASAKHIYKEKEYQDCWCDKAGGVTEYVLPDKTRVDCLMDKYAIEFDFAEKWAESIGQAIYYAIMTKKKPGVVLILEKPKDKRYLKRLETVAKKLKIKVWTVKPTDIE